MVPPGLRAACGRRALYRPSLLSNPDERGVKSCAKISFTALPSNSCSLSESMLMGSSSLHGYSIVRAQIIPAAALGQSAFHSSVSDQARIRRQIVCRRKYGVFPFTPRFALESPPAMLRTELYANPK